MRRSLWVLPVLAVAAATGAPSLAAAPAACPAAKVRVTVDGARSCVAAAAFRQVPTTRTAMATGLQELLAGGPVRLRRRDGRVVTEVIPPRLGRALARAYARTEADLVARARAAQGRTPAEVTVTPGTTPSVTHNADGSVSGTASLSASSGGQTLTADIGLKASPTGTLDIDVNVSFDGGEGTVASQGFAIRGIDFSPKQSCPTATGAVRISDSFTGQSRSSTTFGGARAKLGTIRQSVSLRIAADSHAQMGPDARLGAISFSVTGTVDSARSAQVLAFFGSRTRVVATGALAGSMSPASGAVSRTSLTTSVRSSGFGALAPAAEANMRDSVRTQLEDQAGRMLKQYREIEKRARAGECTTLVLSPGSPADLRPRASQNVVAHLETKPGGATVPTVRWAAIASKGSASPTSSRQARPTVAVKGAAAGPETARVRFKAVSPAGISEGVWVGVADRFPASYGGTVSYQGALGPTLEEAWSGTFTYARTSTQDNPDGSRMALYALTAASIPSHTGSGTCTWASGPGGVIKAGELEIDVDPAGAWTSAFLIDVLMPTVPFTCPPAPPAPGTPKAFLNSRTVAAALRPMAAGGVIAGSGVTDTQGTIGMPATASWSLAPGP